MSRIFLIVLATSLQAAPVMAWERVGNTFVLDNDDIAMCAQGAGCRVIHDDVADYQIAQVRREAYMAGFAHGSQRGKAEACKGPST
jgi:hypothetical protein